MRRYKKIIYSLVWLSCQSYACAVTYDNLPERHWLVRVSDQGIAAILHLMDKEPEKYSFSILVKDEIFYAASNRVVRLIPKTHYLVVVAGLPSGDTIRVWDCETKQCIFQHECNVKLAYKALSSGKGKALKVRTLLDDGRASVYAVLAVDEKGGILFGLQDKEDADGVEHKIASNAGKNAGGNDGNK